MPGPTKEFWEQRFASGHTPWDRGEANPQLVAWLAAGALKPCRILIPGCGSGYEAAALAKAGFDVTALDYAPIAIERTRKLLDAQGLKAAVVEADALAWQPDRPFDAIYEQTCLCALYPTSGAPTPTSSSQLGSSRAENSSPSSSSTCARSGRRPDPGPALPLRHHRHGAASRRRALPPYPLLVRLALHSGALSPRILPPRSALAELAVVLIRLAAGRLSQSIEAVPRAT